MERRTSHARWPLGLLFLAALAWRLHVLGHITVISTDGAHYGTLARHALQGGWRAALDPAWPPLYPLLTAWVALLLDKPVTALAVARAGSLVSVFAGALVLLPVWALALRWGGRRLALIAVLLLAFHPSAVRYSVYLQSDSLFALLFVLAIFTFGAARRRQGAPALWLASGLLVALAVLTRPEGWVLVGVFLGALLPRADPPGRSHRLACFSLPILVLLGPWLFYLGAQTGTLSPGAKGSFNFHHAHAASYQEHGIEVQHGQVEALRAPGAPWEPGDYRVGAALRAAPGAILGRAALVPLRALFDKLPSIATWPLFLLALGVAVSPRIRKPPWWRLLLATLLGSVLFYCPFFLLRRFFLPFLPFIVIAAAGTFEHLLARLPPSGPRRLNARSTLLAGATLALALMLADTVRFWREKEQHTVYLEVGAWLREHPQPGEILLAGLKPEPAFYGEVEFVRQKTTVAPELKAWLASVGATHFFLLPARSEATQSLPWPAGGEPDWLQDRVAFHSAGELLVLWRFER